MEENLQEDADDDRSRDSDTSQLAAHSISQSSVLRSVKAESLMCRSPATRLLSMKLRPHDDDVEGEPASESVVGPSMLTLLLVSRMGPSAE